MSAAVGPHLGDRDVLLVPGGEHPARLGAGSARRARRPASSPARSTVVVVHDGARALAHRRLCSSRLVSVAREAGGAVPTVEPLAGLLPRDPAGRLPAGDLVGGADTPGLPRRPAARGLPLRRRRDGFDGTDTASPQRYQPDVRDLSRCRPGPANLKITYAEDLAVADRLVTIPAG